MNMCPDHWDRLREKIKERGLDHLVASSGELAAAQVSSQFEVGEATPTNFDPLMSAFWAIGSNTMETIRQAGMNPLYLLTQGPEDSLEGFPGYEGRTWPRCGLCYLGLAHEVTCKDERCELPKQDGYAWMLDRAADDAKEKAIELGLVQS